MKIDKQEFEKLVEDLTVAPEAAESRNAINYMAFSALNEDETEENRMIMLAALYVTKRIADKAWTKVEGSVEFIGGEVED